MAERELLGAKSGLLSRMRSGQLLEWLLGNGTHKMEVDDWGLAGMLPKSEAATALQDFEAIRAVQVHEDGTSASCHVPRVTGNVESSSITIGSFREQLNLKPKLLSVRFWNGQSDGLYAIKGSPFTWLLEAASTNDSQIITRIALDTNGLEKASRDQWRELIRWASGRGLILADLRACMLIDENEVGLDEYIKWLQS